MSRLDGLGGGATRGGVLLVSLEASEEAVRATAGVLRAQSIPHASVGPRELETPGVGGIRPALTIVHAGSVTVDVLDVLSLLNQHALPSLAVAPHLTEDEELILLQAGAWDVLVLPASQRRLRTRIETLFRYLASIDLREEELVPVGRLLIYPSRRQVTLSGRVVDLTKTEFELLLALAREPDRVFTRDDLLDQVGARHMSPKSLESPLSRLRTKVQAAGGPRLVEPVRGVGYRLGLARDTFDQESPGLRRRAAGAGAE